MSAHKLVPWFKAKQRSPELDLSLSLSLSLST